VIDRDGTIALTFVDVDYRNRLEPTEILAVLQCLSKESKQLQTGARKAIGRAANP
jgi:hypothetical protein